ncbi:hypothetical protein [Corallococcus exercitus]|uniref:hypothetical protein n=1 Tax=Corallococcus exercitus TaxID=2316736 RepID=UPI0035D4CF54
MSWSFEEPPFKLEFDGSWQYVVKWDTHPAYENGIKKSPCAKAVDFVGLLGGSREQWLYLIELKDYREFARQKEEGHYEEFEQKVCATVSGLVGAHRSGQYADCAPFTEMLFDPGSRLVVVYWVELPGGEHLTDVVRQGRRKARTSIRTQQGKGRLSWLGARFMTNNKAQQDEGRGVPGLKVVNLPQAK